MSPDADPDEDVGLTRVQLEFISHSDYWAHHKLLLRMVGSTGGGRAPQILEAVSFPPYSNVSARTYSGVNVRAESASSSRRAARILRPSPLQVSLCCMGREGAPD